MTLADYVKDMGRRRDLARSVNVTPDYLWQVGADVKTPGAKLAQAIHDATEGKVSRASLRPDLWGRK